MEDKSENSQNNNSEIINRLLNSDAVMIAIFPIFFYFIYTIFRVGYLSYFNIPREFISINLSEIYKGFDRIFLGNDFFLTVFSVLSWIIIIKFDLGKKYVNYFFPLILLLVYLGQRINLFLRLNEWKFLHEVIAVLLLIVFLYFFFPKKIYSSIKGWKKKTEHRIDLRSAYKTSTEFSERIITSLPFLLIAIYYLYNYFFYSGYMSAYSQKDFYIYGSENECVSVLFTDDYALCFPVNIEDQVISNELYFINIGDEDDLFRYVSIGPLRLNDIPDDIHTVISPTPTISLETTVDIID